MPIESVSTIDTQPALDYKYWQIVNFTVNAMDPNGEPSVMAIFVPFAIDSNGKRVLHSDPSKRKMLRIDKLYTAMATDSDLATLFAGTMAKLTALAVAGNVIPPIATE